MYGQVILGLQQFEFASLKYLWLVFLLPVLALIYWYGFYRKDSALKKFASLGTLRFIAASVSRHRQAAKAVMLILAILLLVITLMRPRGNPTEEQVTREGRDVCFLLDVSNSMLANDLKPNRLERAKLAINDVIDIMEGDRASLIIFAGSVALKSPLTSDYHFFRSLLDKVSSEDVGQGGTNIGEAIYQAVDRVLAREETKYKDIILITDGEDLEDSFPVEEAKEAAQKDIRIHTVGLGDPEGTPVPDPDNPRQFLRHDGEVVLSRLDEKTLQKIAAATPNGTYIPVRTGTMDLGELYRKVIATAEKQKYEAEVKVRWTEWFQVPLLIAVLLIIAEWFVSERKGRAAARTLSAFLAVGVSIILAGPALGAEAGSEYVSEGNKLYNSRKYDASLEKYKLAEQSLPESPVVQFNMANAQYQKGDYEQAVDLYNQVLTNAKSSGELERKALYNLGNCAFKEAENLLDADLNKALSKLQESIEHYRDAIEKGEAAGPRNEKEFPEVEDAKHNIEVARLRIKDVLDKLKQQEEERRKEQQQEQDFQKKLKEAIDKQKELEQKTEQTQQEKTENPEKDVSEQTSEMKKEQDENKKLTEELSQDIDAMKQAMEQSGQSDPGGQEKLQKAKQHLDNSAIDQGSASENLQREELKEAGEKQTQARESLEKALEELSGEKEQTGATDNQPQQDEKQQEKSEKEGEQEKKKTDEQAGETGEQKKKGEISPEEAEQKLSELNAEFRRRREKNEQDLRDRGVRVLRGIGKTPVERDW